MRIAALIPQGIINSVYRSIVPMQALAQRGHTVHIEERDEGHDFELLREFDVVHVLRLCHDPTQRLTRRLKEAGVAMVWDNDDNLTQTEKGNANHKLHAGVEGRRIVIALRAMMTRAEVVTTPTPMLAELYRTATGADVRVLENYLPSTFVPPRERIAHQGVMVGWIAGGEHQRDVERLGLRELFDDLLSRHAQLEVVTVGVNLRLPDERYSHIPYVPYGELPMCLSEFDIGIAPLADFPFNRGRSNVKLKEYAANGVPWLASPIGPYEGMGEKQGGRLVADDCWCEELERLMLDRGRRRRLSRRGLRWARTQTIEQHADQWERALQDAIELARR